MFILERARPSQESQPPGSRHERVWPPMSMASARKGSTVKALLAPGYMFYPLSCLQESHRSIKQAQSPDSSRHINPLRDPK